MKGVAASGVKKTACFLQSTLRQPVAVVGFVIIRALTNFEYCAKTTRIYGHLCLSGIMTAQCHLKQMAILCAIMMNGSGWKTQKS